METWYPRIREEYAGVWLMGAPTFLESLRHHDMLRNFPLGIGLQKREWCVLFILKKLFFRIFFMDRSLDSKNIIFGLSCNNYNGN